MKLEDIGRNTVKVVATALTAVGVFLAHSVDDGARFISRELPEAQKAAKELWEKVPGKVAEEGAKKIGEEGLKQLPRKYEELKRKNTPPVYTPQQRSSVPPTAIDKAVDRALHPEKYKQAPSYTAKDKSAPLTQEEKEFQLKYGFNPRILKPQSEPFAKSK